MNEQKYDSATIFGFILTVIGMSLLIFVLGFSLGHESAIEIIKLERKL